MDMFLSYPDEVYFERHVMKFLPETCRAHQIWYLFFIIFILKIKITQNREHGKIYLRFYYYHCVDTTAGTLLVPEGIIHPVVSVSALTWFIGYIYHWKLRFLKNVIIINTQVLLPLVIFVDLACCMPLGLLAPKDFSIYWHWSYLTKVSNLLTLIVPDKGFQSIDTDRTWQRFPVYWHWSYLTKVSNLLTLIVPDKGFQSIDIDRTW
jgi:hypothetical protein